MLILKTSILQERLKRPAAEVLTLCDLFYQLVRHLNQSGELSKETVFIDGTKLKVCANKYTFVWEKSVPSKRNRIIEYKTSSLIKVLKKSRKIKK